MNKRFLFLYIVLAFSLSSCLDETPKDQIPEKEIYDSANSLYVNAVASLYNYIGAHDEGEGLQGTCRGIYDYNTLTTDEAIIAYTWRQLVRRRIVEEYVQPHMDIIGYRSL